MFVVLFFTFSLFTVIYNAVTVMTIIRNRTDPYFKIKFSLVMNMVMCALVGWFWFSVGSAGTYDLIWMLIYLALTAWYAFLLANRKKNG